MPKETPNIVSIIQEMIAAGETEEQIIANLRELGVEETKARKLFLVGQADVLAVLQSEINRGVRQRMEMEKTALLSELRKEIEKIGTQIRTDIAEQTTRQLKENEQYQENKFALMTSKISETTQKALEISELAREKVRQQDIKLHDLEIQIPLSPPTTENNGRTKSSVFLLLLGVGFGGATIYYFLTTPINSFGDDASLMGVILAILSLITISASTRV